MGRHTSGNRGAPLWFLGVLLLWLGTSLITSPAVYAQESESAVLAPIVVTAPRVETPITEVPAAISVVDKDDIQLGQPTLGLDESLTRIPGIFSQNRFNFAQDLRV